MSKCKRCGKCCLVYNCDTQQWQDCKHLIRVDDKKTYCDIYDHRIGTDIGYGFVCLHPKNWIWDIPGCTYFTGKKPIHPAYI